MKILFIFPRPKAYDSHSVRELPSGGTEKATIFLGEAFQKLGHKVAWITTPEQLRHIETLKNGQPVINDDWDLFYEPDIVITQVAELLEHFPNAKRIWWTHHFSDQPIIQQNAAYARCFADHIVTLSECHHRDFKDNLKLESTTIGHGVWRDELATQRTYGETAVWGEPFGAIKKDPYRLIYASTPFRGLERIPDLFSRIREREPRATIAICSSMGTYGEAEKDGQYQKLFDELAGIEGVELRGALNQSELYAEYAKASVFFYPCTWPETYCLALDEAIAHGCLPWVPSLGALPERAPFSLLDNFRLKLKGGAIKEYTDSVWANPGMFGMAKANQARRKWRQADPGEVDFTQPKDWLQVAREWEEKVLNG